MIARKLTSGLLTYLTEDSIFFPKGPYLITPIPVFASETTANNVVGSLRQIRKPVHMRGFSCFNEGYYSLTSSKSPSFATNEILMLNKMSAYTTRTNTPMLYLEVLGSRELKDESKEIQGAQFFEPGIMLTSPKTDLERWSKKSKKRQAGVMYLDFWHKFGKNFSCELTKPDVFSKDDFQLRHVFYHLKYDVLFVPSEQIEAKLDKANELLLLQCEHDINSLFSECRNWDSKCKKVWPNQSW